MSKGITPLLCSSSFQCTRGVVFSLSLLDSKAMTAVVCFWNRSHQTSSVYGSSNESLLLPTAAALLFCAPLSKANIRHNYGDCGLNSFRSLFSLFSPRLFCWFTIPVRSNSKTKKPYVYQKTVYTLSISLSLFSCRRRLLDDFYFYFPLNWEYNETSPLLNRTVVRCLDDIPHSAMDRRRREDGIGNPNS